MRLSNFPQCALRRDRVMKEETVYVTVKLVVRHPLTIPAEQIVTESNYSFETGLPRCSIVSTEILGTSSNVPKEIQV